MSIFAPDVVLPEAEDTLPSTPESVEIEAAVETEATETVVEGAAVEANGETEAADADAETSEETVTFGTLGLADQLVRKLTQSGVIKPFPIQAATIPDALAGKDILGRGRTGSGKTLSFGLPLLSRLIGGRTAKRRPRGLILTPTRELAMQVSDALQPYGDTVGLKFKVVCGGTSMSNQMYALDRGVDILVATPGRLRDLINRGACALDDIEVAVLDEADQMADLGFLPEVIELLDLIPKGGQRMLFSATLENEIATLVKRYLVDPVRHEVDAAQGAVTTMSHHVMVVKPRDKAPVTAAIAARKGRTLIFVRTQLGADRVAEQLRESGVRADALHGGMTQGARTRTLEDFKGGQVNTLVATDVAARGIHVDSIDLVLNVDPAGDHKDYLHRSGRTARAGESGTVVSLALPHQRRQIFRLMEDAGVDASRHIIGRGDVFDDEVARITGVRSLTEVQAESTANTARQAEREVKDLTKQLERAQRNATELREEADRLIARAARERGDDPDEAVAQAAEALVAEIAAEEEAEAAAERRREERRERKREDGSFERRDNDRGGSGGFRRDDRRGGGSDSRGGDRGGFRRDDRRGSSDGRPGESRPYNRDNRESRDRRDNDRGGSGGFRRDDRRGPGSTDSRPFNRDRRETGTSDRRPQGRRDEHRGAAGTANRNDAARTSDRRTDKPRWKRDG
ncbi:DEAD/DEAH box helicase [Streptomyces sp. N2-109]|uniref:DEAD/DEAH box helicase n=1 Tax=Streptomyces gossypii TaxID=2883101 RepID=A0ABT2JNR0_9ACTN|nr:DEAD/DEAH box helicase [Streptomyces gossypii]MCT2589506.1 DEAD/DEAH box helicase [Streptomyces gossypii]